MQANTINALLESLAPSISEHFTHVFSIISTAIKQEFAQLSDTLTAANLTIDKLIAENNIKPI